jgi:hypothetical protein
MFNPTNKWQRVHINLQRALYFSNKNGRTSKHSAPLMPRQSPILALPPWFDANREEMYVL